LLNTTRTLYELSVKAVRLIPLTEQEQISQVKSNRTQHIQEYNVLGLSTFKWGCSFSWHWWTTWYLSRRRKPPPTWADGATPPPVKISRRAGLDKLTSAYQGCGT